MSVTSELYIYIYFIDFRITYAERVLYKLVEVKQSLLFILDIKAWRYSDGV